LGRIRHKYPGNTYASAYNNAEAYLLNELEMEIYL
jgi:hypothetical protein